MVDSKDRARDEFLAEAQELIESVSRDLLVLDEQQKRKRISPETVNDLFRGVHTLKGLAGMFGFGQLGQLAHVLEDLLEDLRLGRVELAQGTLDVLFEGVDGFQRLLAEAKDPSEVATVDLDAIAAKVQAVSKAEVADRNILDDYEFDPGMLSVLTEYEEHRLRTNLERGFTIYRMRISLPLDVIDTALEDLKQRGRDAAEIVTYLPSMDGGGGDAIDIEMLIASRATENELRELLNRPESNITAVPRRLPGDAPLLVSEAPQQSVTPKPAAGEPSRRPAPVAEPTESVSLRSVSSAVRVDIRKLDHLMNAVGELGTVRGAFSRLVERLSGLGQPELAREAARIHRAFHRNLSEVQEGVLDIRMVPLAQLFDKAAVIVRQLARDLNKEVKLLVTGADTEVDKLIAEDLADPLMHIVRNALDHGFEGKEERESRGKPEVGTLAINAYQKGNHVVIELQDDGRGIDPHVIRESAIRKGLLSEQAVSDMSRDELLDVIFTPGFSTAGEVTDISGRGVGMDVVKTNINRLGGAIELTSELQVGTKVTITLPITLAIISSLLFEAHGRLLALPLAVIQEALKIHPSSVRTVEGREVVTLRGETLPLCRVGRLFGFRGNEVSGTYIIVVMVGQRRLGLVVDRVAGQQDIVIKGLGRSLSKVPGISGATDLGDQRLVLVVDAAALLEEVLIGDRALLAGGSTV